MNPTDPPEERLAAYLFDGMKADEREAFERDLENDPEFKIRYEQWLESLNCIRQWAEEDPPGLERIENLRVPSLPQAAIPLRKNKRLRIPFSGRWVWQAAAALLLFLAGYLLGQQNESARSFSPDTAVIPSSKQATERLAPEAVPAVSLPVPPEEVPKKLDPSLAANTLTEENGRLQVETTLKASRRPGHLGGRWPLSAYESIVHG
jgi:anti-sigma factor RsiW